MLGKSAGSESLSRGNDSSPNTRIKLVNVSSAPLEVSAAKLDSRTTGVGSLPLCNHYCAHAIIQTVQSQPVHVRDRIQARANQSFADARHDLRRAPLPGSACTPVVHQRPQVGRHSRPRCTRAIVPLCSIKAAVEAPKSQIRGHLNGQRECSSLANSQKEQAD